MADLIERLRKEESILREYHRAPRCADVLAEAAAALEAAREDAERYRTLRRAVYHHNMEIGEARLILRVTGACPDEREFDAAIDQARGKGGA